MGQFMLALLYLYGEKHLSDFLESYQTATPELIVSSTFPYYKQTDTHLFFPMPLLLSANFENISPSESHSGTYQKIQAMIRRKEYKKIQFLDFGSFQKIISGENPESFLEKVSLMQFPQLVPFSITRNTINRFSGGTLEVNKEGQLFTEDYYILQYSSEDVQEKGLFFLCHDHTEGKLEACLRLLSHWGIGGNRSIGKGNFHFKIEDFHIQEPQNPNALMNLSLYHPTDEEISYYKQNSQTFVYQLLTRRGFFGELINKKFQKKPLFYFKEGSVFPFLHRDSYGKNVIELDKVHRYGMPLMIKVLVNNLNN
ncbi:MAG: hypothetical protein KatS3mg035_0379 [Bacteroidia bacterium]|nr:MAG: hypothetical protein KatS3mg035_0379 [Bacteroidia bacterium]